MSRIGKHQHRWRSNKSNVFNPASLDNCASCIRCCPTANLFAVSSWNNTITCYKFDTHAFWDTLYKQEIAKQSHDRAVLACCWDKSGNHIFSAGCDNNINIWNIGKPSQENSFTKLGEHESSINCLEYAKNYNILISGSWDKHIKYWDVRVKSNKNKSLYGSIKCDAKICAMSQLGNTLIVGLSNQHIQHYDLRKPTKYIISTTTRMKKQLRDIDIFPNEKGFVVTSIGGRGFVKYLPLTAHVQIGEGSFSFKCHRYNNGRTPSCTDNVIDVYSVNVVRFNEKYQSFATGGDDGYICVYDKNARAKIQQFKKSLPITSIDFDKTGDIMVYSSGYNWNKGYKAKLLRTPGIYLHRIDPKNFRTAHN